jgi:hypothetical protein
VGKVSETTRKNFFVKSWVNTAPFLLRAVGEVTLLFPHHIYAVRQPLWRLIGKLKLTYGSIPKISKKTAIQSCVLTVYLCPPTEFDALCLFCS